MDEDTEAVTLTPVPLVISAQYKPGAAPPAEGRCGLRLANGGGRAGAPTSMISPGSMTFSTSVDARAEEVERRTAALLVGQTDRNATDLGNEGRCPSSSSAAAAVRNNPARRPGQTRSVGPLDSPVPCGPRMAPAHPMVDVINEAGFTLHEAHSEVSPAGALL